MATPNKATTNDEKSAMSHEEQKDPNASPQRTASANTGHGEDVKLTTGTPTELHTAEMVAEGDDSELDVSKLRFRILHNGVGQHIQGQEVTQKQLGVDDAGLDRLLDLEAVEVIMPEPIRRRSKKAKESEE